MGILEKLLDKLGLELTNKPNEDLKLDDKIYIRVNTKEKVLIQKYCEFKGTTMSVLIRDLLNKDIDKFIISSDVKHNFKDINL